MKKPNNNDYLIIEKEYGFLATRILDIWGKLVVNFDVLEVYEPYRGRGLSHTLIKEALEVWGVSPKEVYFVPFSDASRALKAKYKFGENI